ncbi:hypothetical protein SAMN05216237_6697 [Pseudomonas yamanorum]|nr:hypothetical protein SAMN05216237_6697 [Pseudomonas yamanorum]
MKNRTLKLFELLYFISWGFFGLLAAFIVEVLVLHYFELALGSQTSFGLLILDIYYFYS